MSTENNFMPTDEKEPIRVLVLRKVHEYTFGSATYELSISGKIPEDKFKEVGDAIEKILNS